MSSIQVVKLFMAKISTQDIDGLADLMTENHTFKDGLGTTVSGREVMRKGWCEYFAMVPDYWVKAETYFVDGSAVGIFGTAGGTYSHDGTLKPENRWQVPAAWFAVVEGAKIAEWRVYADNEPIRQIMEREGTDKN